MKILILVFLIISCLISCSELKKNTYCGKVIERIPPSAAYKSLQLPIIIFYSDSIKSNIPVEVTMKTYSNCQIGQIVCFKLADYQLH